MILDCEPTNHQYVSSQQVIGNAYPCHPASRVDPIRLRLAQKPNKHTQIQPRKRHPAYTFAMEHPELRSAIRRHLMRLRSIQTRIAGSLARQHRPGLH